VAVVVALGAGGGVFGREKMRLRRPGSLPEETVAGLAGSGSIWRVMALRRAVSVSRGGRISSAPGWDMAASWRAHHLERLFPDAVRAGKQRAMAVEGSEEGEASEGRRADMLEAPDGWSRSIWRRPQQEAR
jgi:hypothetical protein